MAAASRGLDARRLQQVFQRLAAGGQALHAAQGAAWHSAQVVGRKTMGKPWENQENHRKTHDFTGKLWENLGNEDFTKKHMGISWDVAD